MKKELKEESVIGGEWPGIDVDSSERSMEAFGLALALMDVGGVPQINVESRVRRAMCAGITNAEYLRAILMLRAERGL